MNIPAAELKKTLKPLASVRSETFTIGDHGVSAKDSDVWVVVDSPLSQLGSFTVVGKKLAQVVNRMSGSVSLELVDNQLTIKSAKAQIVLEAKPAKKIPLPAIPERTVDLNASEFKKALAVAVASASPNKSAGFGGCVQFKTLPMGFDADTADGYRLVGTDSKVLTVVTEKQVIPYEISALLNLTACGVVQIMENTVTYGDGYLKSGGLTVFISKPDQQYPNIDPLLATQPVVSFKFNPQEWLEAFRTVEPVIEEIIADSGVGENHISLHFSDGVVQFSSSGTGATASDESGYEQLLPDPLLEPTEMTLVMIAEHLSGFLGKCSGEATLSFTDMKKPLVLECGGVKMLTFPRKGSKK